MASKGGPSSIIDEKALSSGAKHLRESSAKESASASDQSEAKNILSSLGKRGCS